MVKIFCVFNFCPSTPPTKKILTANFSQTTVFTELLHVVDLNEPNIKEYVP